MRRERSQRADYFAAKVRLRVAALFESGRQVA